MNLTGLVDDCPIQRGDPVFTTQEVQRMDMNLLRNLAAEANSDAVSGRSTKLELQGYFARQRTLSDYHQ